MAPLTSSLALAVLLALPGLVLAAPTTASDAGEPVDAVPAAGAASAAPWRAPGAPGEDEWDDLDAAAKAPASAEPPLPRPARPEAAPPPRQRPAEEPSAAKQMAKSALAWLKELAPWAFSDEQEAPPREIVVTGDMLIGPAHEAIASDPLHRVAGGAPTAAIAVPAPGAGPAAGPPTERRVAWGQAGDPLHEAIAFAREVAQHPMTWLLIALVVLGRLVVWLLSKPVRRARVQRRHRRRHHR